MRLIEAFDGLRRDGLGRPEAADHRRRDLRASGAAARGASAQAAQARAVSRLPAGRHARHPVSARVAVRVPVAVRRLRPAAARGDGERHAGGHVERLVAARGRPAMPRCWWIPTTSAPSRSGMRRVLTDPALAAEMRRKGLLRAREFSWERSVAEDVGDLSGDRVGRVRQVTRVRGCEGAGQRRGRADEPRDEPAKEAGQRARRHLP